MIFRISKILIIFLGLLFTNLNAQTPSIDSLWFSEETDCNDSNIVEICYILSGDTANISIRMSADSGQTWDVPLYTFTEDDGDLGDSIAPGLHCFKWIMSEDQHNAEGKNWILECKVTDFLDTFIIADSVNLDSSRMLYGHGLAYSDGFYWAYDTITGYVYKTTALLAPAMDSFYIGHSNCDIDFYEGYIYYAKSGRQPHHIYRKSIHTRDEELLASFPEADSGFRHIQGIQYYDHSLLCSYYETHVRPNYIYLIKIDLSLPKPIMEWDTIFYNLDDTCTAFEGLTEAFGYLWGSNNYGKILRIKVNQALISGCYPVPNVGLGAEGLCWDGAFVWYQNNRIGRIYKILINDTTQDKARFHSNLDSRAPSVQIDTPNETIIGGATYEFSWNVSDMFLGDAPCSLHFYGCDIDEKYEVDDTNFEWDVPEVQCSLVTLVVAARDSFCNWGYDTCTFAITTTPCDVHPNPFTPEGLNPAAIFEYPQKGYQDSDVEIKIYDLKNRLVRTLEGIEYEWDGRDDDGNPMSKGPYLYLIERNSEIICHGTIYLAR